MTSETISRVCEQIRTGEATDEDVHRVLEYFSAGSLPLLERLEREDDRKFVAGLVLVLTHIGVRHLMHVHKVAFGMPPGFKDMDSRSAAAAAAMVGLQAGQLGNEESMRRSIHESIGHLITEANAKAPFLSAVVRQLYSGPAPAYVAAMILQTGLELEAAEAGVDADVIGRYVDEHVRVEVIEGVEGVAFRSRHA